MKITFKVVKSESRYEPSDCHIILADGKEMMSASEGMEPEDVQFCRDLHSPFECKKLIELVIEKVKSGEEIVFENVEEVEKE